MSRRTCWRPRAAIRCPVAVTVTGPSVCAQTLIEQLEDELELRLGQVVRITHIIDKDWYR